MDDLARPRIPRASWLPLRANYRRLQGEYWEVGLVEEYFGAVGVIFPAESGGAALGLTWSNAYLSHHISWVEEGQYFTSGTFHDYGTGIRGNYPVLVQLREEDHTTEWFLDQDLVFALGLTREGDSWVCPSEDYVEVARLQRDNNGHPELLEIRAEQFRDYLCARSSGLLVATNRSRRAILQEAPSFTWDSPNPKRDLGGGSWHGWFRDIDESGSPYGSSVAVITSWRNDIELKDDVPALGLPPDTNIHSESRTFRRGGSRVWMVSGELWRNEWVEPANQSPRVRSDQLASTVRFTIENDGTTAVGSELLGGIRWLWFRPNIILEISRRRGGYLGWYSEDTGNVGLASHSGLHFGMNDLGLVTVLAKDIAGLPAHVQRLWAAHNVTPDGGVSQELVASQVEVNPADTTAPEVEFSEALAQLNKASLENLGSPILASHSKEEEILNSVHRYQCVEPGGIFRLCKEITRIITDRVDIGLLRSLLPTASRELGSIKLIEQLISEKGADGRSITGPLVGAHELRHADAHLPTSDLEEALRLLGVTEEMNDVQQGKQVIGSVSVAIRQIAAAIVARKLARD